MDAAEIEQKLEQLERKLAQAESEQEKLISIEIAPFPTGLKPGGEWRLPPSVDCSANECAVY